jgi:hypothetical protein
MKSNNQLIANQLSRLHIGAKITRIEMYKQNNRHLTGYLKSISINSTRISIYIDNIVGELSPETISCYTSFNGVHSVLNGSTHLEKILQKSNDYFIKLDILRLISSYVYVNAIVGNNIEE